METVLSSPLIRKKSLALALCLSSISVSLRFVSFSSFVCYPLGLENRATSTSLGSSFRLAS